MRLLLRVFLCLFFAHNALAQGTVFFYNHVPQAELDAPVFDVDGKTGLAGFQFRAQLYAGADQGSLSPVGPPAPFGFVRGYWGGFDDSLVRAIPGVQPGANAFAQVKVWSTTLGGTYDQAAAAGGKHGISDRFSFPTGGDTKNGTQPPSLPGYLTGLRSFSVVGIEPIPEPSTLALLLAALGALRLRWEKRATSKA